MPFHETSVPPMKVLVRREFMTDHQTGHGEYETGILISVRSIPGSCALFQVLLENGVLRDKLPIHALHHEAHEHVHPFHHLQLWNCFSANFAIVELQFLSGLIVDVKMKSGEWVRGRYLWTMQWGSDVSHGFDLSLAVDPSEHKSGHLIELDCGEYAIQPNNRLRWHEPSHVTKPFPEKPDYKVNTDEWNCEALAKWTTEDSDAWLYEVVETEPVNDTITP
jgi:hypothetical protein